MLEMLKEMTMIPGACAHEQQIIGYIKNRLQGKVDSMETDGIGNLVVTKKGGKPGPDILITAHSDEVGFFVTKIEPAGFIRFELRGGQDNRTLPLMSVVISTDKGPVKGHIGAISAHLRRFDNQERVRPYTELYIDIGAESAAEAREMGVAEGDPITWDTEIEQLGKHRIRGHAFDDRVGCAMLIDVFESLDFSKVSGTVYGLFTVQEEVGLFGAGVAAKWLSEKVNFDVCISVDTTPARDTLESVNDGGVKIGNGPAIKILDMTYAATPAVYKRLQKLAADNDIPSQPDIWMGIGTDAGAIFNSGKGVPTGGISVASRNAHSAREVIDLRDLENSQKLLKAFLLDVKERGEFMK
jgi:endoglucanase